MYPSIAHAPTERPSCTCHVINYKKKACAHGKKWRLSKWRLRMSIPPAAKAVFDKVLNWNRAAWPLIISNIQEVKCLSMPIKTALWSVFQPSNILAIYWFEALARSLLVSRYSTFYLSHPLRWPRIKDFIANNSLHAWLFRSTTLLWHMYIPPHVACGRWFLPLQNILMMVLWITIEIYFSFQHSPFPCYQYYCIQTL